MLVKRLIKSIEIGLVLIAPRGYGARDLLRQVFQTRVQTVSADENLWSLLP